MIGPGARLGAFELIAQLGRGGQGEVFLAHPWAPAPGRRAVRLWLSARLRLGALGPAAARRWGLAALKLARPGAADSLHDEHGHLAGPAAAHPHLPQLYSRRYPGRADDLGLLPGVGGGVYLATAYVPGASLELIVRRRRAPAASWSVAVAAQLARALAHLHRRGIVHHDVRPANVIVGGRRGRPHCTLVDLGAAETPAAPRRRAIYGATGHLPPERAGASPGPPTPHVDVYGLGLLLGALTRGAGPSASLAALVAAATADDLTARRAAIPDMEAMLGWLAGLPEARWAPPAA